MIPLYKRRITFPRFYNAESMAMPSADQTERFLTECLLYRKALQASPLTKTEMLLVKTRMYELICDMDEALRLGQGPQSNRHATNPRSPAADD